MSVALLLMNNLDNSKQKRYNLLSPAPPPYLWSLLVKYEGPAPPPSSKISWSFDLAWNLDHTIPPEFLKSTRQWTRRRHVLNCWRHLSPSPPEQFMFPNTRNLRTATRLVHTVFYSIGWPLGKFVHSRRVSKYALYIIRACLDEFLPCHPKSRWD